MRGLFSAGVCLACWAAGFNANAETSPPGSIPALPSIYRLKVTDANQFRLAPSNSYQLTASASGRSAQSQHLTEKPYAREIEAAAQESGLDPALVHAVIHVESRHQPNAVSEKGAQGLMQVLPATAQRFGITDLRRPEQNLAAGTRYLKGLLELFDNRIDLALAAYNAGENAVIRHGQKIPPYAETRTYVPAVLSKYEAWREPNPARRGQTNYIAGTHLVPDALMKSAQ